MDTATISKAIAAAIIVTLNKVLVGVAIACIIFSGPLRPWLAQGVAIVLLGTVLIGALTAVFSGIAGVISAPKTALSPIFALLALTVAANTDSQSMMVTVLAALLLASFIAGLALWLVGQMHLGKLVRFIPYPVIGGFFAGFSFLLFKGGLTVAGATVIDWSNLDYLGDINVASKLLLAFIFGTLLYTAERRYSQRFVFVVVLSVASGLFWSVLWWFDISSVEATSQGWLLEFDAVEPFIISRYWSQLSDIDWSAIIQLWDIFIVICLLAVVMLLFDISAIESFSGADVDLDRELRLSGAINMFGAGVGGLLSLQTAADTALHYKLQGASRNWVLVYCLLCFLILVFATQLLALIPGFVIGGVLVYLSVAVLMNWIVAIRSKLPLRDYVVIWVILVVMAAVGILQSVAAGLLLTIVIFVIRYSQLSVVKFKLSGLERRSNVDRNPDNEKILLRQGNRICILGLQSSIFFGTATRLLDELHHIIAEVGPDKIEHLILDFGRVNDLDTSGANIFLKLRALTKLHEIAVVFTGLNKEMMSTFEFIGLFEGELAEHFHWFDELDAGLEWSETQLLLSSAADEQPSISVDDLLLQIFGDQSAADDLGAFFTTDNVAMGNALFHQNEPADCLYFVLSGSVSIILNLPDGSLKRLKQFQAGALFGEMAFYAGGVRSADAVAQSEVCLMRLGVDDFAKLQAQQPVLAGRFHAYVVRLLAQRLRHADEEIAAMAR